MSKTKYFPLLDPTQLILKTSLAASARHIDKCTMLSRACYTASTIHQRLNAIYGDILLWIFLCTSTEYPLYMVHGILCVQRQSYKLRASFFSSFAYVRCTLFLASNTLQYCINCYHANQLQKEHSQDRNN